MLEQAYVYIMASSFRVLYIGVTSRIEQRVWEHRNGTYPESFASRYGCSKLVHVETWGTMQSAIAREKQLKRWSRIKKLRLIVEGNPDWNDLSEPWRHPVKLLGE